MPTPKRVPSYRLHKPSGRAVVRLSGHDYYLGVYGSPDSRSRYDELIVRFLNARKANVEHLRRSANDADTSVNELFVAYWKHAQAYYVKNGRPTGEISNLGEAMRPLVKLYGSSRVIDFGPLDLVAVRQRMIDSDLCRSVINGRVNRIRRMFKWGVANELVEPSVLQALQAVAPLKRGRCQVRESEPVLPIADSIIEQTIAAAPRAVAAMIRLQRLTAMRPGEVVIMRGIDVDTTGDNWTYRPESHKTEHFGKQKLINLGPQAREIIQIHLKADSHAYLFSPADVMAERQAERRAGRKTPMTPSQRRRKPSKRPLRAPGDRYDTQSYGQAIAAACDRAFPLPDELTRWTTTGRRGTKLESVADWKARIGEKGWVAVRQWLRDHRWSPNQLRHTAATAIRKAFGLEAASVVLGHSSPTITEIYAERDQDMARQVMLQVG